MSHVDPGPLPAYNSLTDPHLAGFFSNTRMRRHLSKQGLVTRRGQIVSESTYRLNMARKEHKSHVKNLLAQAIVHKTLDLERYRQVEIKHKLEEIAKIELVRRVRNDRIRQKEDAILPYINQINGTKPPSHRRKSAGDKIKKSEIRDGARSASPTIRRKATGTKEAEILPLLSPRSKARKSNRPSSVPMHRYRSRRRQKDRPISAPPQEIDNGRARRSYSNDNGRSESRQDDQAHEEFTKDAFSHAEIDTRNLTSLDPVALRKYAAMLSMHEQGVNAVSPYLMPQIGYRIPSPPKSPRRGARSRPGRRMQSSPRESMSARSTSPTQQQQRTHREDSNKFAPQSNDGAVDGQLILHRQEPAMKGQESVQSFCTITLKYNGQNITLPRDQVDPTQEVLVEQQHCGGNTLPVFKKRLVPGSTFRFISRRHRGYPFSLSLYIDGIMDCRVSSCCEYKHLPGSKLGGKQGHFSLAGVTGASACYKCQVEKELRLQRKAKKKSKANETVASDTKKETSTTAVQDDNEEENNIVAVEDSDNENDTARDDSKTDEVEVKDTNSEKNDDYDEDFEDENEEKTDESESDEQKDEDNDRKVKIIVEEPKVFEEPVQGEVEEETQQRGNTDYEEDFEEENSEPVQNETGEKPEEDSPVPVFGAPAQDTPKEAGKKTSTDNYQLSDGRKIEGYSSEEEYLDRDMKGEAKVEIHESAGPTKTEEPQGLKDDLVSDSDKDSIKSFSTSSSSSSSNKSSSSRSSTPSPRPSKVDIVKSEEIKGEEDNVTVTTNNTETLSVPVEEKDSSDLSSDVKVIAEEQDDKKVVSGYTSLESLSDTTVSGIVDDVLENVKRDHAEEIRREEENKSRSQPRGISEEDELADSPDEDELVKRMNKLRFGQIEETEEEELNHRSYARTKQQREEEFPIIEQTVEKRVKETVEEPPFERPARFERPKTAKDRSRLPVETEQPEEKHSEDTPTVLVLNEEGKNSDDSFTVSEGENDKLSSPPLATSEELIRTTVPLTTELSGASTITTTTTSTSQIPSTTEPTKVTDTVSSTGAVSTGTVNQANGKGGHTDTESESGKSSSNKSDSSSGSKKGLKKHHKSHKKPKKNHHSDSDSSHGSDKDSKKHHKRDRIHKKDHDSESELSHDLGKGSKNVNDLETKQKKSNESLKETTGEQDNEKTNVEASQLEKRPDTEGSALSPSSLSGSSISDSSSDSESESSWDSSVPYSANEDIGDVEVSPLPSNSNSSGSLLNLRRDLTCLDLTAIHLTQNKVKELCHHLEENEQLEEVIMRNIHLGELEIQRLTFSLKNSPGKIKRLTFDGNNLDVIGASKVAEVLKAKPSIESLTINSNPIGDDGIKILVDALLRIHGEEKQSHFIKRLSVEENGNLRGITEESIKEEDERPEELKELLNEIDELERKVGRLGVEEGAEDHGTNKKEANLAKTSEDYFIEDFTDHLINLALQQASSESNIGQNDRQENLSDKELSQSMSLEDKSKSLDDTSTKLDEKSSELDEKSSKVDDTSSKLNEKSSELDKKSSELEEKSVKMDERSETELPKHRTPKEPEIKENEVRQEFCHLKSLELEEVDITDAGVGDLAVLLAQNTELSYLQIQGNTSVTLLAWEQLAAGLHANKTLEHLSLNHCPVKDDGMEAIINAIKDNSTLRVLDLVCTGLGEYSGRSLVELLKRNTYLTEINLMPGNDISDRTLGEIKNYLALNQNMLS